jgi:hypothetical protein
MAGAPLEFQVAALGTQVARLRGREPGDGSVESNATEIRRDDLLQTRFRMNMGRVNGLMKLAISLLCMSIDPTDELHRWSHRKRMRAIDGIVNLLKAAPEGSGGAARVAA